MDEHILGEYFRSLEGQFQRTLAEQNRRTRLGLPVATFCLVFSAIPVIPYLLAHAVPMFARRASLIVHGHRFPLDSVWRWWLLAVLVGSLAVWGLATARSSRERERQKRSLPVPQMRFALCYASAQEIRKYQTNRLPEHIDKAVEYSNRFSELLYSMFGFRAVLGPRQGEIRPDLPPVHALGGEEIYVAPWPGLLWTLEQRFDWFRIDPKTASILKAIQSFDTKTRDRIKDKKDLEIVDKCFMALSAYLYSTIPENSAGPADEGKTLESKFGMDDLETFTNTVNSIPPYVSETNAETKEGILTKWLPAAFHRCGGLFSHQNMLICFLSWYVVSGVLVLAGVKIALLAIPNIALDSIIVSTIIGTPLVVAVTAMVTTSHRRKQNDS